MNKLAYSQPKMAANALYIRFLLLAFACVLLLAVIATRVFARSLTFNSAALNYGLVCIVIVLGVPHGALDFTKARRTLAMPALLAYACAYVAITALTFYLLGKFPAVMLPLLLFIASWHFGETYRGIFYRPNHESSGKPRPYWLCAVSTAGAFAVGALPVVLSTFAFPHEVSHFFTLISGGNALQSSLQFWALGWWFFIVFQLFAVAFAAWRVARASRDSRGACILDFAEIIATFCIFALAPPLIAFTLYFCFVHAPRHTVVALQALAGQFQLRWLLLEALLVSVAAVALVWLLWLWLPQISGGVDADSSINAAALLFSGLLSITVAHAAHDGLCRLLK